VCTLILWFRVFDASPLLVAANRDELISRPSAPPRREARGDRRLLFPRDLQAGGTWLGINDAGLFAGITNRFGAPKDSSRRSRGGLVLEALEHESASRAALAIEKRRAQEENAFHLLLADRASAHVVWSDGSELTAFELEPGLHVFTERSFGAAPTRRESNLLSALSGYEAPPTTNALRAVLSGHTDDGFEGACVHVPTHGYGTRSSTIVRSGRDLGLEMEYADGPPCSTPFSEAERL
jgi:uncharacterized protein with NRDE domain